MSTEPKKNWAAGLEFIEGNLGTLLEYLRRDIGVKTFETPEAPLFIHGPYIGWLKDAQAKITHRSTPSLKSAFLDIDRVRHAFVRLCQHEYCARKAARFSSIDFWDFHDYKWLKEILPEYHPVHGELKELLDSLRPDLGDADLDRLLDIAAHAEKETFRLQAENIDPAHIKNLQTELSGKLDDVIKSLEHEHEEENADLPIVDFVEGLLIDAAVCGAREIEIAPDSWRSLVQYRIGDAHDFSPRLELPPSVARVSIIRLKILASLDIAHSGSPQEGRIQKIPSPKLIGKKIFLSTMPVAHREKALIRLE